MTLLLRRQWLRPLLTPPVLYRNLTSKSKAISKTPKLIITPGSTHHNDLPSFLAYARRVNLQPSKTVYVGTHYEYTVAASLLRLGFSLIRTGRRADNGIDLLGHWTLSPFPEPLPVIVQCKAHSTVLAPKHVRELEGAFQSIPLEWRRKDVLGLLVTTHRATKGVLEALGMNRWPMGFLKVSRVGVVEQFVWNRSAVERRLEGVGVTARYLGRGVQTDGIETVVTQNLSKGEENIKEKGLAKKKKRSAREKEGGVRKDIQLTWMGKPVFPDREELDEKTVKLGEEIASGDEELPVEPEAKRKSKAGSREDKKEEPKKRGRPPGSQNQKLIVREEKVAVTRKAGRPKGSKNKKILPAVQDECPPVPRQNEQGNNLHLLHNHAQSQIRLGIGP